MSNLSLKELSLKYEHFDTPEWAAKAILEKEILTPLVFDAGCGLGVLSRAALSKAERVISMDVHDWGYEPTIIDDFLAFQWISDPGEFSVFMNPPFSKAVQFVEKSIDLGARKIVCFQRFAWWESKKRKDFWEKLPPNRIYICGDRADCWRHDIPQDQRGGSSPTAHAWFVWEKGHPRGTLLSHIYKK